MSIGGPPSRDQVEALTGAVTARIPSIGSGSDDPGKYGPFAGPDGFCDAVGTTPPEVIHNGVSS